MRTQQFGATFGACRITDAYFMPGGTFFFTVVAADRTARTLTEHVGALREAWRYVRSRHPFRTDAVVVLPDHLHAVWTLPSGDADFSLRWRLIKERFSRAVPHGEPISASRRRAGERGIWQRRFLEHLVRNEADLAAHVDYIHYNPVRHGLTARASIGRARRSIGNPGGADGRR